MLLLRQKRFDEARDRASYFFEEMMDHLRPWQYSLEGSPEGVSPVLACGTIWIVKGGREACLDFHEASLLRTERAQQERDAVSEEKKSVVEEGDSAEGSSRRESRNGNPASSSVIQFTHSTFSPSCTSSSFAGGRRSSAQSNVVFLRAVPCEATREELEEILSQVSGLVYPPL